MTLQLTRKCLCQKQLHNRACTIGADTNTINRFILSAIFQDNFCWVILLYEDIGIQTWFCVHALVNSINKFAEPVATSSSSPAIYLVVVPCDQRVGIIMLST